MNVDSYSRKWQITINNPIDKGYTHEVLRDILGKFKSMAYWCMSDEIGEGGTHHTHIYLACASVVRFSTIKKRFDGGHFEMAKGTSQDNRDYVFKEGKWANDVKAETNLPETHEEYGEMPLERPGKRNDIADLYDMIRSGMTNAEIIECEPNYLLMLDKIDKTREVLIRDKFQNTYRDNIEVTYISGPPGCGKTRYVYDKFGCTGLCSVTDYYHPFDGYAYEDVLLFDEFRDSLPLKSMLQYLDIYPLWLPARFNQKTACYTKVFIISNWMLEQQYVSTQRDDKSSWDAFLRRIHNVITFEAGTFVTRNVADYLRTVNDFKPLPPDKTPWFQK